MSSIYVRFFNNKNNKYSDVSMVVLNLLGSYVNDVETNQKFRYGKIFTSYYLLNIVILMKVTSKPEVIARNAKGTRRDRFALQGTRFLP